MSVPAVRLREIWDGRPTYGGWCTMPGSVSAEIVGKSRTEIVETSSDPSPGMLKTLSITTLPLIR